MGRLIKISGNGLVERYCDECQSFDGPCGGGQQGECKALNKLMKQIGSPVTPVVNGNARADKCKMFNPHEFAAYAERAVDAGLPLDGVA